jgi:hypothetical protein
MGSSARPTRPAHAPARGPLREASGAEGWSTAGGACPEEKRSQSKPLKLRLDSSVRCMRFLEIEATGTIRLPFKRLERNRGRFLGAKDRHAPGFWGTSYRGPKVARPCAPTFSPLRDWGGQPLGCPCRKTILECPLDSRESWRGPFHAPGFGPPSARYVKKAFRHK